MAPTDYRHSWIMRVLVACEFSGVVRDAFAARGHDAWSCDLLPSERGGQHIQRDVLEALHGAWDLMIAHPPCTYLSYAGLRWFKTQPDRYRLRDEAMQFFMRLFNAQIPRVCVENPRGFPCRLFRKPDQVIHPYYFGDTEQKATCLWLRGLPKLQDTIIQFPPLPKWVNSKGKAIHWTDSIVKSKDPDFKKTRSRTFQGIADAMAEQWGNLP